MRDENNFTPMDNKTYNRFNNNLSNQNIHDYNTNSNNNLSMVNYQVNNKYNGMINSTNNFDVSANINFA